MLRRIAAFAALLPPALFAQFSGLSSSADGSSVYFASALQLKGASEPTNGKIFVAAPQSQNGVTLFQSRDPAGVPADSPPCTVAGFADYIGAETSSAGVVALSYRANSIGGCSYPRNPFSTEIVTPSVNTSVHNMVRGVARLSAAGRYAIIFLGATGRPADPVAVSFLDLQSGAQQPVQIPPPQFPQYLRVPLNGGRIIANDGTALVAITDGSRQNSGYLLRPGAGAQPFPVAGLPLLIDASASKVLYQSAGLRLLDLRTLQSTLLIPADQPADALGMSDDARRLLFWRDGQVHVLDTALLTDRALTNEPARITEATLSGDGTVVYAVTGRGSMLKINVDDGTQMEIIGRTPYLQSFYPQLVPGLATVLTGAGLSDSVIDGTLPLSPTLANVTIRIGDRRVPIVQVTPNSVRFLVPWDINIPGTVRIVAEAPGENTPFDFPAVDAVISDSLPRAGALARQTWERTYSGPVNTGEIIHVYAIGLGPVSPDVPEGAAAPAAEPFSRVTRPLACSNAEVLYAGLAPGAVERIYQIDLRIGPTAGYQKFTCTLGGGEPFVFLTLNVVP